MFEHQINLEKAAATLASIAEKYPPDSEESKTLELAGFALHYIYGEQVRERFVKWRESLEGGLSPEQEAHLRALGIDPNSGEDLW